MIRIKLTFIIILMALLTASAYGTGLIKNTNINSQLNENNITIDKFFNKQKVLYSKDEIDLRGDIYDYQLKSPMKAFAYSLVVPGAGQYYLGKKYRAISFLAVDALLWTGYFVYHSKGVDKENEYQDYADEHYSSQNFLIWWNSLSDSIQNEFSHRLPVDEYGNPIFNHEYYENIGKYDQFQVGWPGGTNYPPIGEDPPSYMPDERRIYLQIRKESNDAFSNAKTSAMISIANHLISAFDAAIGAKRMNKGGKQFSLKVNPKNIDGRTIPVLTFTSKF